VRKLVLAALAAWVIALPSVAAAQQQRGEGQGRPRAQPPQQQQDMRGGGFSGMLGDIAGARLNRAHVDKRSDRPPPPQNGGGRGGGGAGPGGRDQRR
jgi:hypothetical protein